MFLVEKTGAVLRVRFLGFDGEFTSWARAKTFSSRREAFVEGEKTGLCVRVVKRFR